LKDSKTNTTIYSQLSHGNRYLSYLLQHELFIPAWIWSLLDLSPTDLDLIQGHDTVWMWNVTHW